MPFPLSGLGPSSPLPVSPLDIGREKSRRVRRPSFRTPCGRSANSITTPRKSVENFLSGEDNDLHKTIMATQRADLAGELFLQVRNKIVAAYQEVMRMQV